MNVHGEAENREKESAAFSEAAEAFEGNPPEAPPPFAEHLAYEQLVAELEPVTIERIHEEEKNPDEPGKAETDAHLHEVINAAEQGEALEGELERRHEIKDEPSASAATSPGAFAASVGQVLAQLHQQTQAAHAAFQRNSPPSSSMPGIPPAFARLRYVRNLPDLYQRALFIGLLGGVLVIAIGLIVMLNQTT